MEPSLVARLQENFPLHGQPAYLVTLAGNRGKFFAIKFDLGDYSQSWEDRRVW